VRTYLYPFLIIVAATLAMVFPTLFISVGDLQLKRLIVPLLQIIMFGMGTTMGLKDFEGVVKAPRSVFIGLICQFSIMPVVGYSLAVLFDFPAEIAAGVILVGCSPSGLASNVMSFIAKANVALSLTITAVATLLAPFLTPLLMKGLAGTFVAVDVVGMMLDIMNMIILPIGLGLLVNYLFRKDIDWIKRYMPLVSMAGITLIICIITAAGRESLLTIGLALILCTIIHNLLGYTLGYNMARLFRLSEQDCRTVALEVGLQNAGLASGLALQMGKIATVGLAPALFGPIMNITGSLLASFWGKNREAILPETDQEVL